MANANTNLMSININPTAGSTGKSSRIFRSSSKSGAGDFNSALNRANAQITNSAQVQRAKEIPDDDGAVEKVETVKDSTDVTSVQGQNEKTQDAPQQINQKPKSKDANTAAPSKEAPAESVPMEVKIDTPKEIPQSIGGAEVPVVPVNVEMKPAEIPVSIGAAVEVEVEVPVNVEVKPAEVPVSIGAEASVNIPVQVDTQIGENVSVAGAVKNEDIPDAAEIPQAQPVLVSAAYFAPNAEALLNTNGAATVGSVNLMTILPKNDEGKAQAMLDILSGKTWKSADVQESIMPQNLQPVSLSTGEIQPTQQMQTPQSATPIQTSAQMPLESLLPNIQQPTQVLTQEIPTTPQIAAEPVMTNAANLQRPVQLSAQPQIQIQQGQPQPLANAEQPVQIQQPQILAQPLTNGEQPAQLQPLTSNEQPIQQIQPQVQPNFQPQKPELNQMPQPQVETPPQFQQHFGQQISPIINVVQPHVEGKQLNEQQISQLLNANLTVEQAQPQPNAVQQIQPQQPQYQEQQQPSPQQQAPSQHQQQPNEQQDLKQTSTPAQAQAVEVATQQPVSTGEETFAQNLTPAVAEPTVIQQPTQVQNSEAVLQMPREDFDVPAQIVQQARLIRTAENTEMVINLKPEHLGQLTIRISVGQSGALTASFYTNNAQVQAIIENSLAQLRQELNDQGLKVEDVQVYAGLSDGGLTNGQGQQAWQQNQQQPNSGGRHIDFGAFQEEADAVTPVNNINSTDGVDYKV